MRVISGARAIAFVGTAVILAGCEDKKPAPSPAASVSAPTTATPAPPPPGSAPAPAPTASAALTPMNKPFGEKLKCETLLPEKSRQAAGMLNYKMTQQVTCGECGPTCNMVQPGKPFEGLSVAYACNEHYEKAAADKVLDETKRAFKKPVVLTAGRGAVMGEKDNGTFYSAVAFDDDTDCKITIDWMRGDKKTVEPLVKMAIENAKAADVAAARK